MGMITENNILRQSQKTNDRLDTLIEEQRQTNALLAQLVETLHPRNTPTPGPAPTR